VYTYIAVAPGVVKDEGGLRYDVWRGVSHAVEAKQLGGQLARGRKRLL
jgi:hypothetical protein